MVPAIVSRRSPLWPWALASLSAHAALLGGLLLAWPVGGPEEGLLSDNVEVELLPAPAKRAVALPMPATVQPRQIEKQSSATSASIPKLRVVRPDTAAEKAEGVVARENIKNIKNNKLRIYTKKEDEDGLSAVNATQPQSQKDNGQAVAEAMAKAEAARNLAVRQRLEQFKHYPISARRRGIEGAVDVSFRLNEQGRAEDMQLVSGSGYDILDEAALDTVHRAEPFPAHGGFYRFRLRFRRS